MSLTKGKKIVVEIIGGAYPQKRKCRIDGDKIILQEGTRGRGGAPITATYDNSCLVPYMSGLPPFRHVKFKLILKDGASKCVSFAEKNAEVHSCTKKEVAHYGEATVIKLAGALKPPFSLSLVYVLLIISIILTLVGIGVGTGSIRL